MCSMTIDPLTMVQASSSSSMMTTTTTMNRKLKTKKSCCNYDDFCCHCWLNLFDGYYSCCSRRCSINVNDFDEKSLSTTTTNTHKHHHPHYHYHHRESCYPNYYSQNSIKSTIATISTSESGNFKSNKFHNDCCNENHQQKQQKLLSYEKKPNKIGQNNQSIFVHNINDYDQQQQQLMGNTSCLYYLYHQVYPMFNCLKESQKVSVIERKSSSNSTTTNTTSNNNNNNKIAAVSSIGGRHHGSLLKSNSSSSTTNSSSGSTGGTGGGGGSAASNFFKLFTSSSKAKIPTFGFSSSSSNNNNNNNNNNASTHNNLDQNTTNNVGGGSTSSTISSNSSLNTVTIRADSILSGSNDPESNSIDNHHLTYETTGRLDQHRQQQYKMVNGHETRLTIKSISVDSANPDNNSINQSLTATIVLEPVMPSNEILFRKYFTFYDLLSSINLHRLFVDNSISNLEGPCSSLLDLTRGTTPTNNGNNSTTTVTVNPNSNQTVTTFESSTLSSTSSYSSCTSSMSSSSHQPTTANSRPQLYQSLTKHHYSQFPVPLNQIDIGNELLAPSPNFLNEIGCERQYSIELTWNNGFKEEIPSSMLQQQQHEEVSFDSSSSYLLRNTTESSSLSNKNSSSIDVPRQFHPPSYSKRINIFSDASPFVAYTQHSVMSDLYGGANTSGTLPLNHTHSGAKKLSDLDFQDLDDGFGSLSSSSLSSTYPGMTNLVGGGSCSQSSTFQPSLQPGSHSRCPFGSTAEVCNLLEMDYGTSYYRTHFRDFEHQNWLQINDKYGPIIVSLRKERVKTSNNSAISSSSSSNHSSSSSSNSNSSNVTIRWRVIVRTTSLIPLRGTIATLPSICLPTGMPGSGSLDASNSSSRRSSNSDHFNINSVRDVLSLVVPKSVNVANFRLGSPTVISQLLKIDEMSQNTEYKIGVLYAYGNQHSEEEFYNNILDYSSSTRSSFYDFLGLISSRIRLKEFKGYKAGLDVQNDTTGEYSWTAKFGHTEIMFHVCTELPFNSTNRQQLPRKRHIGNDIVTIVFLHENFNGSPFTPALIRSKFQQVFIIVKPFQNGKYFRVAIARHKLVPLFGPPVKPYYTRQELREFILTKIINAENACHSVNKFAEMAKRTRHEYLTEMCQKHSLTQTVAHVDSSLSSNSLNSFKKLWTLSATNNSSSGNDHSSSKHRSKSELIDGNSLNQLPYVGHILNGIRDPPTLNGAILFSERCAGSSVPSRLYVHDYYANRDVEVQLLLSNEAILVIEAATMEVIWAAPVTSIIGWTDSRGVFATSSANCVISNIRQTASTSNSGGSSINKLFGDKKSKSVDSEPSANHCSMLNDSSRELRLYYHQGECIQLMQRPINPALKQNQNEPSLVNGKLSSKHQHQNIANQRNNDPFLMLIRVLELITCKSELRAIVIKRKSSATRSITSKSASNTPEHRKSSPPHSLSNIEPVGTCGGEFGFQMKMSTGIIEEIFDQTLSIYHLVPGCKVLEIDKISFAAMAMDELQELVNSSLIMCLTFTPYDFARLHPRCNCPWPKALQLQHKQKSQQTPPSDYENVTKSLTNTPLKSSSSMIVSSSFLPLQTSASSTTSLSGPNSGVKTIHITQNNSINQQIESNVPNASSPSSTNSSYYSPNTVATSNSNQQSYNNSFSIQHGQLSQQQHQLYSAKSATSLNQLYQQQSPIKIASSGQNLSSSPSTTSTSLFNHQQPYRTLLANNNRSVHSQTAITTQPSTLKDNLIRLITMDDYNQNVSPMDSPSAKSDLNDFTPLVVGIGHQTNDMSDDAAKTYYGHCHETSSRRPQTIGGGQYSITTSNTPIHNCQQQHYRYSTGPKHDTESTYSSYAPIGPTSNCRYSTSSQYSSQSRTSSGSNAQTTIHVNASHITVPVISGQQPQQQHTMLVRTGPYGKESTTDLKNSSSSSNLTSVTATSENNDCYLLTAQPVRVDASNGASITSSSTANNQPQQQQQVECVNDEIINVIAPTNTAVSNNSMMSQSYDCNSLYQSLLTGSIHSAGDPIGDIVWPSMHSSMDHHSYLQQQARSSTMTNNTDSSSSITNCDTNSSNTNLSAGSASVHQVVPPQHLTDEVRKLSLEKDVLNDTISKLREENQRLHMESQTASQQLRKLTEWFFNSNPNAVTTTASTTVCEPSPTYSSNTTNTTTISIHPKPKSITTSTPTSISTTTTEQTIQ